jgi:predicted RNase H-like HicB family nuclease
MNPATKRFVYWSEPDEAFIAEVPELPGCAADGASYQEALAAVEVVINELGRSIPKPRGRCQACQMDEVPPAHSETHHAPLPLTPGRLPLCRHNHCFPRLRRAQGSPEKARRLVPLTCG